jgi:enoyl-CoA hydratase/carnithine racemase
VPVARTLGNCLSAASCARLIDVLGPVRVRDLLITARLMPAAEAQTLGLVNRMVDPAEVDLAVVELAGTLTAHAPLTIWATKEMVRRTQAARRLPAADGYDVIATCYGSSDFREGVAAFLARRPPRFTGQ